MSVVKHKGGTKRAEEENLLEQFVSKYLPYWPLFLVIIVIALGLAYLRLRYTVPVYQATATIIIKDEKKGNEESKLLESLDQISSKKIVENEIEVIQSRSLMERVVRALDLYAPVYQKGDVHSVLAYTTSPVSIIAAYPDSLRSVEEVDFRFDSSAQRVLLNNNQLNYPLNEFVSTPYGKLKFIPNKEFISPVGPSKQLYFSLSTPKRITPSYLGGLMVDASGKLSSVVQLSYRDADPQRAENILNELINAYQQSANDEKDALAKNTLDFVSDRLNIVSHDLDSIERQVQQYKSGNQAVDLSSQSQLFLQNVGANDQKLGDVNTQLAVLDQVENFVKSNGNSKGGIVPSTLGVSDPLLSQLTEQLYNAELEYNKLSKTVGENNPDLVALSDKIKKIKPSIISNINSQRQTLNAAKQNIAATNSSYNALLRTVPLKERQLVDISREQQIKSNLYAFLLQKKEESEIAAASPVSNSRVVDYALAGSGPVGPKKTLIYLVLIILGIGLAGAIVFVKEFLTGKVLYRKEIEKLTDIPVISEIAFNKSKQDIVIRKGDRSFVAEEFRKLRISLSFLGIDSDHKKILVTSSIPDEGKSFVAANLAVSLALTGKKVALVDMDLNNPTIDRLLNVNRDEGVTEFLEGLLEPIDIIKTIDEHENLYFISAGVNLPENPSELLASGKTKELLQYLSTYFDAVVIDTSPMALVTDGYLITGLCDATLYVVRHKYTPKMLIKRLDENNHINPINNPAIVFNAVKTRGFVKSNYGYGYDYVYGKKYGGRTSKKPLVKY